MRVGFSLLLLCVLGFQSINWHSGGMLRGMILAIYVVCDCSLYTQNATDQTEPDVSPKKLQTEKLPGLQKGTENLMPSPAKPDLRPRTPPPVRPAPPKVVVDGKTVNNKEEPTVESLQADIKELRMALELLQTRHDRDMQEVKEELREERNKRQALQEEVSAMTMKQ